MFRSMGSALKALAPSMLMLAITGGIMGVAAIPLDITTSMVSAIAVGAGVDSAIHYLWRRRRLGESLAKTTAQVGPSAFQVAAKFLVLGLSSMIPLQRFGLLGALTMILSALATFVLLPAMRVEGEVPAAEDDDISSHESLSSEPV
jgi:predicted RND superfamily exporter protein